MKGARWRPRWHLGWLLFGICLVLLAALIGDWKDYVDQILNSGFSSGDGYKFGFSAGWDRAPGWLTLLAGWCCFAHGLGAARKPPSEASTRFARLRFRLRWLPVPIVATLGTYVALAYHRAAPLIVTIDVINAPPGITIHGGPIAGRRAWHDSRYGAAVDYLFAAALPARNARPVFYNQPHSEFRFPAGRFSLQNWQPDWERVFVGLEDERQGKSALVSVLVEDADIEHTGTISVTRETLKRCHSIQYGEDGACWILVTPYSFYDRDVHVVFDLAGIELEPYGDAPYFNVELLWGANP
jgi:hypothetical protein